MDPEGTKLIDLEDFKTGINQSGLSCSDEEVREMFERYIQSFQNK